MSAREIALLSCLALAAGLIIYGLSMLSDAAAWIAGGVLVAAMAWLTLGEA